MKDTEIKVLKDAIISEIEGYEFYKMAAKEAPTEEAKAAFLEIAQEEKKHVEWLSVLFNALKSDVTDKLKLAEAEDVHTPKFFRWENLDRDGAAKAISVFGIGIQMERAAVDFYKKAAEESSTPEIKALYGKLALWEQVHEEQFSKEYNRLKEEWWSRQEFAPF